MSLRSLIIERLWQGVDPFKTFQSERLVDHQGWNSAHPYLAHAIEEVRPAVVAEIGVWKGGSVITMAQKMRDLNIDGVVIAIDTWLGSSEHRLVQPGHYNFDNTVDLGFDRGGMPRLYEKFMSNILDRDLQDYVVPLPSDSNNAAHIFKGRGLECGVLHLDGGHDYEAVSRDLRAWWGLISPGGILIADDYHTNGVWPEVRQAVDELIDSVPNVSIEHFNGKAYIRKPTA